MCPWYSLQYPFLCTNLFLLILYNPTHSTSYSRKYLLYRMLCYKNDLVYYTIVHKVFLCNIDFNYNFQSLFFEIAVCINLKKLYAYFICFFIIFLWLFCCLFIIAERENDLIKYWDYVLKWVLETFKHEVKSIKKIH